MNWFVVLLLGLFLEMFKGVLCSCLLLWGLYWTLQPSFGITGAPIRWMVGWFVRRFISKEMLLAGWQRVSGEHHIQVGYGSPYVYLHGVRRLDNTYYIQNKFNVWIKASTPCRGEDGISIVQIDLDGTKSTLQQPNGIPCSRDEWVSLFGRWNDTFKCYFYVNRYPSASERLVYSEADFNHYPREGAQEMDCHIRVWIRAD
jgi:hypothetical protein